MTQHKIKLGNFEVSNELPFFLIAGPCQMESREHALEMAEQLVNMTNKLGIKFVYKSSFDKANRTSVAGKRGIGMEKALPVFAEIREKFNVPVITDIHSETQCREVAPFVDVLQVPAFLCRQTDILKAAAETGKVVNVKKGQFLAPWDMKNVAEKVKHFGNDQIMLTERGVTFGYNTLVVDYRSLVIMAETGYPVIFDATHAVQQPSGQGGQSGGQREFVPYLAKAAASVGIAGIFMETHQDPDNAPSDGPCMVKLSDMEKLLTELKEYDALTKN